MVLSIENNTVVANIMDLLDHTDGLARKMVMYELHAINLSKSERSSISRVDRLRWVGSQQKEPRECYET